MSSLPRITVIGTGGTIAGQGSACAGSAAYRAAVVGVDDLLANVPGLERLARLGVEQIFQIDSADFDDERLLALARRVQACLDDDAVDGVVITHGTDTLEESAYFLHLVLKSRKPVVLTGAMRPGTALAADGPRNLFQAVAVAAHASSAGRGVLVAMDDDIHCARDVSKTHSMALRTFASPFGPLGLTIEARPRWYRATARPHTLQTPFSLPRITALPPVAVVTTHGGVTRVAYDAFAAAGVRGIVHAGFGGGTVPERVAPALRALRAGGIHVVRASRMGGGALVRNASFDDDDAGSIVTDDQNAPRARLLLALGLTLTDDARELQTLFDTY